MLLRCCLRIVCEAHHGSRGETSIALLRTNSAFGLIGRNITIHPETLQADKYSFNRPAAEAHQPQPPLHYSPPSRLTMKAIKILSQGHAAVVSDAEIPTLPSDEWILVKTVAVALNPTDWKHFNYPMGAAQPTSGCDFAGIVEQVGSAVPRPLKKGNRVWGFTHGGNQTRPYTGAFGEYLVTKGGVVGRIPEGVSFEEAATAGVGILTVGQGLYQRMGLPWPDQPLRAEEKMPILIWGGSSATGALGIQFAKL